ncbi:MAG: methionine gamma-lyase family protein [Clostridia bacterium]|nr:methionine gamma-lyase family protein [Clostridia bacterium]
MEKEILDFVDKCENNLSDIFKHYNEICLLNQEKVLTAFRNNRIGLHHFNGSTGYGYDDQGREKLGALFAEIFEAEAGVASPLITCGSHAVAMALFGLLKSNDTMVSITGKPYDTLDEVILGENNGGFKDYNINYHQIDLKDLKIDEEKVYNYVKTNKPKLVFIQRSRGYEIRKSLSVYYIKNIVEKIKKISPNTLVMVDNCYCEFMEKVEPCAIGADICVGSLIKNPGGGIAPSGGYYVGTKKAVDLISGRFTSPSLHTKVGSFEMGYRMWFQGLFMAPHTTNQAIKGSYLIGEVMKNLGYDIIPNSNEFNFDIVKSIKFNTAEELIDFVRIVQKYSPVDSDAVPFPWKLPGYSHEIIMGAGTFVQGATMELSCDAPIKKPFWGHIQGGLTYEHVKIVAIQLAKHYWKG